MTANIFSRNTVSLSAAAEVPVLHSGNSLMQNIIDKVSDLVLTDFPVIIIGETGSGKKRIARIIHNKSPRARYPFYSFYCVDVNETEYTNAFREQLHFIEEHIILKYDALENAIGGTLYLDQFSELPVNVMEGMINSYLIGCHQIFRYDSTNRPRLILSMSQISYEKLVYTSSWNMLLFKIDPVTLILPPLRERKEDIGLLIRYFIGELRKTRLEWQNVTISSEAFDKCIEYGWPGNVRQLKNALMQGTILSHGQIIEYHHLPFSMSWQLPYQAYGDPGSETKS